MATKHQGKGRVFEVPRSNHCRAEHIRLCFTLDLSPDQVKSRVKLLAAEKAAYDCGAYKDAPPGLRFWCGATVETSDIEKLLPWLDWAYEEAKKS